MRSVLFTLVLALSSSFLACGSDGDGEDAAGEAGSFSDGSGGTSSAGIGEGGASTGGTRTAGSSAGGTRTAGSSSGASETGGSDAGGNDGTNAVEEARHPLELVLPRAAGSAPASDPGTPDVPSGHRIFKAYPGIEYNIRAAVLGGSYPFTYTLSNAPFGMTIDENTGEISWPDPSDTATPTLTVTDAQGTTLSSSWTIDVTTNGFRFVDDVNGSDDSAGTLESPWKTISKVKSSGVAGEIVIFREGTYRTTGMETGGGDTWVRVELNGAYHPVQWLAYPGETAVLDNDYVAGSDNGRFIRFSGSDQYPVYLDGFEITHAWDKALQFGSGSCDYPVFRRLSIHDIAEAIDGSNSAGIMTLTSNDDPTWYGVYQDNDFHHNAPGGIKQYSHQKVLWEDCLFRDSGGGPDLKAHVPRFEVRNCSFYANGALCGLFGNMHEGNGAGSQASGEVRYNRMSCAGNLALNVNQDGQAAEIHIYRNTLVGTVSVAESNPGNGPFHFTRNVIVNDSASVDKIDLAGPIISGLVTYSENLAGTMDDGLVDEDGNLQGSYVSFLGTRGHQVP